MTANSRKVRFFFIKQIIRKISRKLKEFMSLKRKLKMFFTKDIGINIDRMFNLLINLFIGPVHCSRNTLNGDLASATIPEENRLMAKKKSELEDPLSSFSS